MSRAMLISCSRRWRSRSRSTRRALSRMLAASPARASRIWRSSVEKAAGRIQVEDAEEIAALDVDHGLLRVRAGHGEKRNDDDSAEALRDDALRGLQINVGLREVFGDDRRLMLQSELDGGLAGREAFGGKTKSAAAPSEFYFERAAGIGFEQQTAIGVGDGDGVIQHVAQHHVERQLRVQQRGRFQEALEFHKAAARRLRAGDMLHPSEQLGKGIPLRALGGAEDDLVRVVESEGDRVAIL